MLAQLFVVLLLSVSISTTEQGDLIPIDTIFIVVPVKDFYHYKCNEDSLENRLDYICGYPDPVYYCDQDEYDLSIERIELVPDFYGE